MPWQSRQTGYFPRHGLWIHCPWNRGAQVGAKLFRVPEGGARRTFIFTTSLHNYGYILLPLWNAFFDRDTMGVLFAYYLGVELALWSMTVAQLTGHAERGSWRRALNPPIVAIPTAPP